uniref:Metalloendopeptidase n=1 Tax=Plectus sambesii TaxID=2011161 RepID=A0A914UZF2_9BILA
MTQLCALSGVRQTFIYFCLTSSMVAALFEPTFDSMAHVIARVEANGGIFHETQDPMPSFNNYGGQQQQLYGREPSINSNPDSIPSDGQKTHHEAWMSSGKYQGDIDGISSALLQEPAPNVFYNGLRNKKLMWPNGIIPYKLDSKFTQNERSLLEKAFQTYRERTCIRFVPHSGQTDFLQISKGYGCYSQVGRNGGQQEMSLGRGCLFHEIIVHELMHSVGFWHEHSRSDRDSFIRINWGNILPGMQGQFD